eukprot:jgi/Botrbrau1/19610/Bobra.0035s0087.1
MHTGWSNLSHDVWLLVFEHLAIRDLARMAHLHSSFKEEVAARTANIRKICKSCAVDVFGRPCLDSMVAALSCFIAKVPKSQHHLHIAISGQVTELDARQRGSRHRLDPGVYIDIFVWPRWDTCRNNIAMQLVSPGAGLANLLGPTPFDLPLSMDGRLRLPDQEQQVRFGVLVVVGEALTNIPHHVKHRMRQLLVKPPSYVMCHPRAGRSWSGINKMMWRMDLERICQGIPLGKSRGEGRRNGGAECADA